MTLWLSPETRNDDCSFSLLLTEGLIEIVVSFCIVEIKVSAELHLSNDLEGEFEAQGTIAQCSRSERAGYRHYLLELV